MIQDEIIEMAIQAEIDIGMWEKLSDDDYVFGYDFCGAHENLEAFAKLVAEKEREACAKYVEEYETDNDITATWLNIIADAIRARGQA
jgi:hypothetical protein